MNNQAAQKMPVIDDFNGDNAKLVESARALISLSDSGSLAPHGIGGHARAILSAFIVRTEAAALSQTAVVAEPGRYFAGGPQGHFFADDLQLARDLVNLYDKDDDWTITDLRNPTGAAPAASGGEDDHG